MHEEHRVGRDYLRDVTSLLQRVRSAHPTKGLYEAADFQWWWRNPRSTDEIPQLFWFDEIGRPVAAVIVTDWGDRMAFDPILMPDATPDWVAHVIERGLAHASSLGIGVAELEVDHADEVQRAVLLSHGFEMTDAGFVVEAWLPARGRPAVSELHEGYRLASREETLDRPHHMINPERNHADVEPRLRETSLYRADLDLLILGPDNNLSLIHI